MSRDDFKTKFIKALGMLAITLGEEVSEERFLAYHEILRTYDHEAVLAAIHQAAISCEIFPKPAKLIELMTGGKGGGKDPAVAWQEVMKAIEDIGPYGNVEFSDGAIGAAVMGLGGWPSLCEMIYEELTLQRIPAKFAALYAEAVRHGRHRAPGALTGIIDRDNAARGYELESPTIRAKTMDEIMALAEKPQLPESNRRSQMKLLASPEMGAVAKAEIDAAVATLAKKKAM